MAQGEDQDLSRAVTIRQEIKGQKMRGRAEGEAEPEVDPVTEEAQGGRGHKRGQAGARAGHADHAGRPVGQYHALRRHCAAREGACDAQAQSGEHV